MLIMNLPIGSISAPPGVTHGSQLSRLLARRGSDTSNTRVSSVQHFEAHFALCNTSSTGVCSVQHFVKSTTFSCPTDTCWWRHAAVTGKRGSGKLSTIFHYFPLFSTICYYSLNYFPLSSAEGRSCLRSEARRIR